MESEMKKRAICEGNTAREAKGRVWRKRINWKSALITSFITNVVIAVLH